MRTTTSRIGFWPLSADSIQASEINDELKKSFDCFSPSRVINVEGRKGDNGIIVSPIKFRTPQKGTEYKKAVDITLYISDQGAKAPAVATRYRLFQSAKSASRKKRTPSIIQSPNTVSHKMTRPQSQMQVITRARIDSGTIASAEKREPLRKLMGDVNASEIMFSVKGDEIHCEFSHMRANHQGGRAAHGVAVAPAEHNTMRLVAVELCGTKLILDGIPLYYSDVAHFIKDQDGSKTQVIDSETALWENEDGDAVKIKMDPNLKVTPAKEILEVVTFLYRCALQRGFLNQEKENDIPKAPDFEAALDSRSLSL